MLGLIAAAAVSSHQVYLDCRAKTFDGGERHVQLGLNESEGTVALAVPEKGYSLKLPAAFNEDEVTWNEDGWSTSLNRSTLKYRSTADDMPSIRWNEGYCMIRKPPVSRKF